MVQACHMHAASLKAALSAWNCEEHRRCPPAHLRDTRGQCGVDQVHAAPREAVEDHEVAGGAVVADHHVAPRGQPLQVAPGDVQAQNGLQHCVQPMLRLQKQLESRTFLARSVRGAMKLLVVLWLLTST